MKKIRTYLFIFIITIHIFYHVFLYSDIIKEDEKIFITGIVNSSIFIKLLKNKSTESIEKYTNEIQEYYMMIFRIRQYITNIIYSNNDKIYFDIKNIDRKIFQKNKTDIKKWSGLVNDTEENLVELFQIEYGKVFIIFFKFLIENEWVVQFNLPPFPKITSKEILTKSKFSLYTFLQDIQEMNKIYENELDDEYKIINKSVYMIIFLIEDNVLKLYPDDKPKIKKYFIISSPPKLNSKEKWTDNSKLDFKLHSDMTIHLYKFYKIILTNLLSKILISIGKQDILLKRNPDVNKLLTKWKEKLDKEEND